MALKHFTTQCSVNLYTICGSSASNCQLAILTQSHTHTHTIKSDGQCCMHAPYSAQKTPQQKHQVQEMK